MNQPRPDIYTARPPDEDFNESVAAIKAELTTAGLDTQNITIEAGLTQPDGSIVYYVYLGGAQ